MKQESFKIWPSRQSLYFESIWSLDDGTKAKIEIRRDSYDFQSHARMLFFDPVHKKWNRVASIPYPKMDSLRLSHLAKDVGPDEFTADESALLNEASLLVGTE